MIGYDKATRDLVREAGAQRERRRDRERTDGEGSDYEEPGRCDACSAHVPAHQLVLDGDGNLCGTCDAERLAQADARRRVSGSVRSSILLALGSLLHVLLVATALTSQHAGAKAAVGMLLLYGSGVSVSLVSIALGASRAASKVDSRIPAGRQRSARIAGVLCCLSGVVTLLLLVWMR